MPATGLSVATRPELPIWPERVEVVVDVMGCAPSLSSPELLGHTLVKLRVTDACPPVIGFEQHPFTLIAALPPLAPGSYTIEVDAQGTITSGTLSVYGPTSVVLELPEVASSDDPTPVQLLVFASCSSLDAAVEGRVIRIDYDFCPIEPPPPRVNTLAPVIGPLAPGTYEVRVYDHTLVTPEGLAAGLVKRTLRVRAADRCLPSDTGLCLQDGRFRVEAGWRLGDGTTGAGHALPLADTEESGQLWFFAPDNTELTVKLLDACGFNHRWWVFVSSSSTVEYRVTVTDTTTGATRTYDHAAGALPALVADTDAFGGCP